ncbi:hypothetical protein [Vibrio vulnificus]|uniref:hypothetical protein n=1 Tax=Vibrio vulnificus TaxID=672 RepID=UPI00324242A5
MKEIKYNIISGCEVKAYVYAGDKCDQHEPYLEAWCEGDMDTERSQVLSFNSKRWPVGTKLQVMVPVCPTEDCHVDAESQDENGKCTECGFDWKNWAEERYS